jgi:hypothetical protein
VGQHLGCLVVGELRSDVREPVEPATDPDRGGEDHTDRLDHDRGPVGRDGGRCPHPPGEHVAEELDPGGRRLLVADGQVQEVLAAFGVDRPGDEEGLLGPLAAERLEDGVGEVLGRDLREVAGDKGLVVLPQPVGDLGDGGLRDEQLARSVSEGVLDVPGRQPPGGVSVTRRSAASELPSRKLIRLER